MPAATTMSVPVSEQGQQLWYRPVGDKVLEPFSTPITAAEHKIRNLEKRKLKLDQYRNEQADGKTLNADQLAAVSKYSEVIQQLEHNKELVTVLRQVHQHTIKFIKQELRRENAERSKFVLALQTGLDELQNPTVQNDLLMGENGAAKLSEEDLMDLNDLAKGLKPSLRETEFGVKIEAGAEILCKLFESRGKINNKPSQHLKALVDNLVESPYFTTSPVVPVETIKDVISQQQEVVVAPHVPDLPISNNQISAQLLMDPAPHSSSRNEDEEGSVKYEDKRTDITLMSKEREMAYSFMQESQLEIESPHMDPAVVAVSSYAPPPPPIQQAENNHVFTPASIEGMTTIQSGMRDLNLNHMNSNNIDDEGDWDDKITTATFNNSSSVNGNIDDDNTNGFDRSGRGSFRGRGGRRGRGTGYGNPRPPKSNRGFNHARYGAFRADRVGQSDMETSDFRGKGGRGFPKSFRGNGNAPPSGGGPPRRGRGSAKPFNGIHEARSSE